MAIKDILEIDGSIGEGGGSILRLSAGFSILYNKPIKILNIRAKRPDPGLKLQHLLGLTTLSKMTNSKLSRCEVGTTELTFVPNNGLESNIRINISTAAALGLLLQPIQIAALGFNTPEKVEITMEGGGTFGEWAPSLNYLKEVTYPILKNAGFKIDIAIQKHGWYPKGGARTKCTLYPARDKLKPINLVDLGNIDLIQGEILLTQQLNKNIGERIKKAIAQHIQKTINIETNVKVAPVNSLSPGVGLSLWARSNTGAIISSGTILGEKILTSEQLGMMAASEIVKYIQNNIPVDNYLSDQLIPLMAYVNKPSKIKVFEVTSHAKTNLDLIKAFNGRSYNIVKSNNHYTIEYP